VKMPSDLGSFALRVAEAISYLAITGLSWKVAVWVLTVIGV